MMSSRSRVGFTQCEVPTSARSSQRLGTVHFVSFTLLCTIRPKKIREQCLTQFFLKKLLEEVPVFYDDCAKKSNV